ncbi:MAG TPA: type II secretion system F family protein [Pseudohongiella sp.]|nr:secretion system protein [Gammaproteobacteria bacterium]HBN16090.1 type II secretion system F family protein [Pseudohongiella sp.]|tara:strand:- start:208 stop:1413 length:1206 start_codon:yes stop_codon:yes gene_type:complete
MPLYRYRAMNKNGRIRQGNLDAANDIDLEQRLGRMNLDLIRCSETEERRASVGQKKVEKADLINFCFHMEQLTRAGVPLLEGLVDLRDSVDHPRFKEVIANLVDEIEGGKNLSDALEEHPKIFDTLFVNLIRAGELSGELAKIFNSLVETIKWQDELQKSTKKLLMTPMIVATTVLGVTIFLMVFLVPQLVGFIESMGEELPGHTRALIAVSNFMVNYWYVCVIAPPIIVFAIKMLIEKNEAARYQFDRLKLVFPKIGSVLTKILLARFTNFFAMMYAAGIPVLRCLEIAESIIDNLVIKRAIMQAHDAIQDGDSIADSFRDTELFPPLVVRMMKVGETTGELDKSLLNVSYFFDRDIKDSIEKVQALIAPVMTAILGLLLGWVMMSVLGPIYNTISSVQI